MTGALGEPFRVVVEEGKVHEFARATRSQSAAHLRPEQPVAPPTYLSVALHWRPDADSVVERLGLDPQRILHGAQEYVFHTAPPRAGDVLMGQQRVERVYSKESSRRGTMRFVDLVTDYWDESGALAVSETTTLIEAGSPLLSGSQ